jgi:hypothetical protein
MRYRQQKFFGFVESHRGQTVNKELLGPTHDLCAELTL